jgi:hypothetical protein
MDFKQIYQPGDIFFSPGCLYRYEVVGACCPLFDREDLPYPSCSLNWKGKQPSWRRIGRRFTPDLSAKGFECYNVRLLDYSKSDNKVWIFTYLPQNFSWWCKTNKYTF